MEHHSPIIEEAEKEVCFQTLVIPINTIEVLIHYWIISDRHSLHSCTTIIPLFLFTLSFHGLQSSPPSFNTKVAFFKACKSPGSSDVLGCKEASRTGQQLCDYCTSAKYPHCPHLQSEKCRICPQQELIEYSHYLQKRCLPNQQIKSEDDCSSSM